MTRTCLVLAISSALLAGCGSSTNKATGDRAVRPVVLTLANWMRADTDVGEWVQAVERLSRGAIKIELRGSWRRGEAQVDRGMLEDVRAGRVDLGHIPTHAWDTLGVDSFQALEAPMLVDSLDLEERVLTDSLGAAMLAGVRDAGVVPVALLPGPVRRPVGVSRDLLGPGDYRGASIGLRPSGVHEATARALGARVAALPAGDRLDGLDGTEADFAALDFNRLDLQARSVTTDVVLWPRATTLVMNRKAWERLTREQRAVLTDAARAAVGPVLSRERKFDRGGPQSLCAHGFALVRAGDGRRAALRRAVEPVYRELASDAETRRAIEHIRALAAGLPAQDSPACGSEGSRRPATADSPLVGGWKFSVTRKAMAAARRITSEAVDDNWGNFKLTFGADGRFEMLNDRYPGPVGLGEWSVRGEVLTFTPSGTLEQGAGETWRYRWTLFRGSLVLQRLTADAGPTALTVAPMRRR